MDCNSASAADRVADCGDGVQCPNDRNPIFFMTGVPCFRVKSGNASDRMMLITLSLQAFDCINLLSGKTLMLLMV
jgi:hypothetical protein